MRHLDWQLILFVGTSLIQDYWIYFGLPRIHYWDVKHQAIKRNNDEKKAA
ncbi:hypothetical protein [Virgibacillus phasianinus]|nr:hypothetical protein [Virgibacillus phasianinus]